MADPDLVKTRLSKGTGDGDDMAEVAVTFADASKGKAPIVFFADKNGNITPPASEATLAARFGPVSRGVPVQVTASGDTTVYTPTAGKAPRMVWISGYRKDGDVGAVSVDLIVKIGGVAVYQFPMSIPEAFAHNCRREGAADNTIVVNLSGAAAVTVNLDVQEF
jgi:hypothetical protein